MNPLETMSPILTAVNPIALPASDATCFVVGQDSEGHWIAVETHGRGGGLFRDRQAAFHYAESQTSRRQDAVIVSGERIELRL